MQATARPAQRSPRAAVAAITAAAGAGLALAYAQLVTRTWSSDLTVPVALALAAIGMAYLVPGAYAILRRPDNRIGVLFALAGVLWLGQVLVLANEPLLFTVGLMLGDKYLAVVAHVAFALPSGRLCGSAERAVVTSAYGLVAVMAFAQWLFVDPCLELACPGNLLLIRHVPAVAGAIWGVYLAACLVIAVVAAALLLRRLRRESPAARRAITPVLAAVLLKVLVFVARDLGILDATTSAGRWLDLGSSALIPAAFVVALARSELAHRAVSQLVIRLGAQPAAGELQEALVRALGDPTLELLLRTGEDAPWVDATGHPVPLSDHGGERAITYLGEGAPIGALVHDPVLREEPALLDAVAVAAGIALHNHRLAAEVAARLDEVHASRARIVAAGDAERRRLERDLHDGAQQRLLSVALELGRARRQLESSGAVEVRTALEDAAGELDQALEELRDLARGILPTILADGGLAAALESLAQRAQLPVEITAVPQERYGSSVETAVYFLAAEALTNTLRHGRASHLSVHVERIGDRLDVTIADDGVGGASPDEGSGLRGLQDRVESLDGDLHIHSRPGCGTTLTARLPLASGG